jgi:hypothetical protein
MVPWSALLFPILASAALVFVVSSLIHMVIKWHQSDYRKLPNEEEVRAVLKRSAAAPGQYIVPHCKDSKDACSPEMAQKFAEGPNLVMHLRPNAPMQLGPFLGKWVLYTVVVSALVAYVARIALPAGTDYLQVFRVVGFTAWLAYAWQGPSDSIWKGKPWSITAKEMFDGLLYGLVTAGAFGWLWPRG